MSPSAVLSIIGVLMLILAFVATVAANLLWPSEEQSIRNWVTSFSFQVNSNDPRIVMKAPLKFASRLLDRLFGKRLFTLSRLRRSLAFGGSLFAFSLCLSILQSGELPFPVDDAPWRVFDRSFTPIPVLAATPKTNTKELQRVNEIQTTLHREIEKFHNPENRLIYTSLFYLLMTFAAASLFSLSVLSAQRMLAEMETTTSLLSLFAMGVFCLLLLFFLYLLSFAILCVIASPMLWLLLAAAAKSGEAGFSLLFALVVTAFVLLLSFFVVSGWFKILLSVVVLPVTATLFLWPFALVLFFFRKPFHWLLTEGVERLVRSKLGLFGGCAALFGAFGTLALAMAKLL